MAAGDVKAGIVLADWSAEMFDLHADHILLKGQIVFLDDQSGFYKKGDGISTIGELNFLGGASAALNQVVVGTGTGLTSSDKLTWDSSAFTLSAIGNESGPGMFKASTPGRGYIQISAYNEGLISSNYLNLVSDHIFVSSTTEIVSVVNDFNIRQDSVGIKINSLNPFTTNVYPFETTGIAVFNGSATSTDCGMRIDNNGIRIAQNSYLNVANTIPFQIDGVGGSSLKFDSRLSVIRTTLGGSIYAQNNSFNVGGDGPVMVWDGTGSGATLSLGYSNTATFNIRPHSGQLLFEGAGASNGSFSMHGVAYVTQGLSIGTGFGNFSNMLEVNGDTKMTGKLNLSGLPNSSSGLISGDVWNNNGVLNIV